MIGVVQSGAISTVQAIVLAIVQGITELFPISSLGHAVVLPRLLGWDVDQNSNTFLPFLVVLHLGTATALLLYFWRDWVEILGSLVGVGPVETRPANRHLFWLIVLATIPAGLIGLALQHPLERLFGTPWVAAVFLMVNGVVLFVGERLRRRAKIQGVDNLNWKQAFFIGVFQSAALIPGISRSGITMVAGLAAGLRHESAARFSFLLATPIIGAAGLLEVPKLLKDHSGQSLGLVLVAGVVAGIAAFFSVWFLMRYFKQREIDALDPFAYYCGAAGLISLILLLTVR